MIYQPPSQNYTIAFKQTVLYAILFSIIYILGLLKITQPLSYLASQITTPISEQLVLIQTRVANEINTFLHIRTLTKQNKALEYQNTELLSQIAQHQSIAQENIELRTQLGALTLHQYKQIPATVLSRDRILTVSFQANEEIQIGSFVIYRNHAVGQVTAVEWRKAKVTLITDPDLELPVEILTKDNEVTKGLIRGNFGTSMKLERVSQNSSLTDGNLVVLTQAPGLPAGVVVGQVSGVRKIESELFQQATVQPLIALSDLSTVFIIK